MAAGVLFVFPPERYGFYPRCPVYETFGLLCPGCGATRAAAALLHGHVLDALHWNALFVAALFTFTLYALIKNKQPEWRQPPVWLTAPGIAMAIAYGIARNL